MSKLKKPTLVDLEQKIAELTEALQRERADATNIRRRHEEQISGLKNLVKAHVVHELLPVIDNVERALVHVPNSDQQSKVWEDWAKGVIGIKAQFAKALADIGVQKIKTVGEVFDPRYHEAVAMEDGNGTVEVICEELQPGYKIGDDVIRHAMVKVRMEKEK